jgi:mRNA interferase RelE/StbE
MADYSVTFSRSAQKELEALSNPLIQKIFSKIESLSNNPRPPGCAKLQGFSNLWRIRIGDYRVVYSIDDISKTIDITRIRHRREVYE